MAKAFLSHSSIDKKLVEKIGSLLGSKSIIDSKSFEEGMGNLEEIICTLDSSDLFVLFISENSLNSEWVQKEIILAKEKLDNNIISKLFPIVIDPKIIHSDKRIPEWMTQEFNLRPILREGKILKKIKQRLKEISWKKHPNLKKRDELFVGRNTLLSKFEERIDDIYSNEPITFIASGLKKIGRRTFLKNALLKSNVIFKDSYDFPVITLSSRESIEDFIIKLYDLGFSERKKFPNFLEVELTEKIEIAVELLKDCQKLKEIILIEDTGCIIKPDRVIVDWFNQIIRSLESNQDNNIATICIASKFRLLPHKILGRKSFMNTEIPELTIKERIGLLKRCCNIYEIELKRENIELIIENCNGFPGQIHYCVDYLQNEGLNLVMKNLDNIKNYQSELFNSISTEIEDNTNTKKIISTLTEFDFISCEFLYELHSDISKTDIDYQINSLSGRALIEYIGANKEYIRLNDGVRDFLLRAGYKINSGIKNKLKLHIEDFIKNDNSINEDISDFFYSMKGALMSDYNFKNRLLLPSHYLKTMISLYERDRDFKNVILLADKVLEKESKIDLSIKREIKYWLCLALAREKNERFKEEVQFFESSDYNFLFGFYYRMIGKPEYALENFENAILERKNFSRAKRELVQVLTNLELFDDALTHARDNYENETKNPFQIQAYFDCLIKSEKSYEARKTLKSLINELDKIQTKKAEEMHYLAESDYSLIIETDPLKALKKIDEALAKFGKSSYIMGRKFNILEKLTDTEGMQKIIDEYSKKNESSILTVMKIKLEAIRKNEFEALKLINSLKFYPERSKEKLKNYVKVNLQK